jgi:hypothetical protein
VLYELARGEQIELAGCRSCSGMILADRLSVARTVGMHVLCLCESESG